MKSRDKALAAAQEISYADGDAAVIVRTYLDKMVILDIAIEAGVTDTLAIERVLKAIRP